MQAKCYSSATASWDNEHDTMQSRSISQTSLISKACFMTIFRTYATSDTQIPVVDRLVIVIIPIFENRISRLHRLRHDPNTCQHIGNFAEGQPLTPSMIVDVDVNSSSPRYIIGTD